MERAAPSVSSSLFSEAQDSTSTPSTPLMFGRWCSCRLQAFEGAVSFSEKTPVPDSQPDRADQVLSGGGRSCQPGERLRLPPSVKHLRTAAPQQAHCDCMRGEQRSESVGPVPMLTSQERGERTC